MDKHNFEAMYHKSQCLAQIGMSKQAISLLRKAAKNSKPHVHEHASKHLSLKDKILGDDLFVTLQNKRGFLSLVDSLS